MVAPLISAAALPPAVATFTTALHQKFIQELREFHTELQKLPDALSQHCAHVCDRFAQALQVTANAYAVIDECKMLLQHLMIDPISRKALTTSALLGSDGETYNRETIVMHRNQHTHKSPLHPADPAPFTVVAISHTLKRLIQWSQAEVPGNDVTEQQRQQEEDDDKADLEAFAARLSALRAGVQSDFAEQRRRTDEHAVRAHERIDAMHDDLMQQQSELATMALALEGEVDAQLSIEVHEHALRIADLERKIQAVRLDITACRQQDYQLQLAIEQTKKAIKERERAWVKDLVKAVAIIGACWFAQWALGEALAALGSTAKVASAPAQSGGLLRVTLPIPYK